MHTIWTPAILVFAGAVAVILWRRRDLVARAVERHALLRPALLALPQVPLLLVNVRVKVSMT